MITGGWFYVGVAALLLWVWLLGARPSAQQFRNWWMR
jgi:hypothetical protein